MFSMDNHDSAKEWMHFAQMDLQSAKYLQGMRPQPLEVICYHCQQTAEKCLKAIIINNKHEPRKIHDLIALLKDVLVFEPNLTKLITVVAGLSDYATITRYPPSIQIGSAEMLRALKDAEEVFSECKKLL